MFEVVRPFEDGEIASEMLLMHATEGADEIAQTEPDVFHGVAVDLMKAMATGVSDIFILAMSPNVMCGHRLVKRIEMMGLITEEDSFRIELVSIERNEGLILCVWCGSELETPALSADHAYDGRTIAFCRAPRGSRDWAKSQHSRDAQMCASLRGTIHPIPACGE